MKLSLSLGMAAALLGSCITLNATAQAAPAGSTGQCKDGTYSQNATKSGACAGHKGVKTWFAAAPAKTAKTATTTAKTTAPAATAAKPAAMAPMAMKPAAPAAPAAPAKTASTSSKVPMAQAPGGGPGMVWVNTSSKVYHCPGTTYYGKTKQGAYMSEADAKAKGNKADANKPCTK
jgi:hypothetical protein